MLKSFTICVCATVFMLTGCIPSEDKGTSITKPVEPKKNVMGTGGKPPPNRADYQ